MTPDERHMIEDLFQRLAQSGSPDKDRDAERLIVDMMRRNSDAAYMLVQTALVYEYQLNENQNRIADLEAELATIRSGPQRSGGSFLGGRVGSARGSVPSAGSSPWGSQARAAPNYDERPAYDSPAVSGSRIGSARNPQSGGFAGRGEPPPYEPVQNAPSQGGMMGGRAPIPPPQAQPAAGGGFFRSALATAAGVAGGVMLANSLGSLFGGGDQAQAATGGSDAAANAYQDGQQDAQLESEWAANDAQDAAQDSDFDLGGFDSFET